MANRRLAAASVLLAVSVLAFGCASGRVTDINRRLTSLEAVAKKPPDAAYVVDPPDTIRVEFMNETGLTRDVQVRSDGCVTLPHVQDVEVVGLTALEIRDRLEELYAKYYKEPQILVSVTQFRSKHIYVYGEVRREGTIPYTGSQTVADAIGTAGGITRRAARGRVKVIRGDPVAPEIFKVDLDDLILEGDVRQDVSLAENDVVYVPPNVLAWLGYQIDNVLFPFRGLLSAAATAETISN